MQHAVLIRALMRSEAPLLHAVRVGAARELGARAQATTSRLRVDLSAAEHDALLGAVAADYVGVPFEPQMLRDGAVLLPSGPAGARLVRALLGEVPHAASKAHVTRNAKGTSRDWTMKGSALGRFAQAVFCHGRAASPRPRPQRLASRGRDGRHSGPL